MCQVGGLRFWTGAPVAIVVLAELTQWGLPAWDHHGLRLQILTEMTTARYVQKKSKLCTKIIKNMHLHVIENLYIYTWTPTVVAHWILTMSHHVTVPSEVGPSAGHYSFGHPAGTVGYCAPEVAQPVRVLP